MDLECLTTNFQEIMETIIGLVGGAIAAGVVYYLRKLSGDVFLKNYGTVIAKTFDILDPVAGKLITGYSESEVQQAIELVVTRVGDSDLSEQDVVEIANYVIAKFNPALAAAKTLDLNSEEGRVAMELVGQVKALHDGASMEEVFAIARSAQALF